MSCNLAHIEAVTRKRSPLLDELKQTKPFASAAAEGTVALLKTADVVRRRVSGVVEPHGVTLQQYNVLRILRGAGEGGLPTLEIGERLIEETPGVTRLLDRLEAKGLVRRTRCPRDRRRVLCEVTKDGLALLARMDAVVLRADEEALGRLPRADVERLLQILEAIRKE